MAKIAKQQPNIAVIVRQFSLANADETAFVQAELAKFLRDGFTVATSCATGEHRVTYTLTKAS